MIKFRQKMYVALPAAGALLSKVGGYGMKALEIGGQASMIGGMFQQHQQMKQADEHQEENAKLQRQQIAAENRKAEAIQNLANSNVAGTSAGQAIQYAASDTRILKNQKLFGYSWKDIKGFGKDLGNHISKNKKTIGSFLGFGALMTGGKYLADKIIQQDKSIMNKKKDKKEERSYSDKKPKNNKTKSSGAPLAGTVVIGLGMGMLGPTVSYIQDKIQRKSLAKESEKYYSVLDSIKRSGWNHKQDMKIINKINKSDSKVLDPRTWKWLKKVRHNPLRGIANVYNSMQLMGGETGMRSFRKSLTGKKSSGSKLSKDVANFTKNHGATSMAAIGLLGGGALFKASNIAEKSTEKALRALDKNAFKYTDSKEEEVK